MTLDDQLRRSTPPTAPRTPELERSLAVLLASTEATARRPRRRRRIAVITAAAFGSVGLATAAATAAGLMPAWVPWTTGGGESCQMQFTTVARGADGERPTGSYSAVEQQRAAADASAFLADLDYSSIDQGQAVASFKRAEDAAIAAEAPTERQPRLSGDDLELSAVGRVVWQRVEAHLRADGIARPADAVTFSQGWRCE